MGFLEDVTSHYKAAKAGPDFNSALKRAKKKVLDAAKAGRNSVYVNSSGDEVTRGLLEYFKSEGFCARTREFGLEVWW